LAYSYDEFEALNTELIPILVDTQEHAKQMEEKYAKNKFSIYYDREESVAKQLNQQWVWWKLGRMPGLFIVDKQGVIRFAYYSDSMADIPKTQDVLEVLKGL
jgi:peroxiredoxin